MWFSVRCDTPVQNSGCRCPDLNIAHDVPKIREAQRSKHNTLFASHLPLGQSRSRDQQDKSKRGCMNTGLGQNRKTWCARRVCLPTKASWRYSRAILARPINRSRTLSQMHLSPTTPSFGKGSLSSGSKTCVSDQSLAFAVAPKLWALVAAEAKFELNNADFWLAILRSGRTKPAGVKKKEEGL